MNNMSGAAPDASSQNASQDIKLHFLTREGCYKNLSAYEYSRPNRSNNVGQNAQQGSNVPVKMNLVQVSPLTDSQTPTAYQQDKKSEFLLFNVGREILLYAFKSIWEAPDLSRPLDRQIHKVLPTCHDINKMNCSAQGCSLIIGFVNGAFQLYDLRKESHIYNEDRLLDKTRVTCVKWIPGSTQQFLVGFSSGQLFQCDESLPWLPAPPSYQIHKHGEGYAVYTCKSRTARNPVYRWMIGEGSLSAFAFSPCTKYLACVSHDGYLRVFLFESMDLLGTAKSYFGGLLCLAWSPDSKFVCCAGEDDLVHLFSLENRKIVARGRGHRSWVTAVSFDPMTSCLAPDLEVGQTNGVLNSSVAVGSRDIPVNQRIVTYRFASVGQDTQICLWELTDDIVKQAAYSRLRAGSLMTTVPLNSVTPATSATKNAQGKIKQSIALIGTRAVSSATGPKTTNSAGWDSSAGKVVLGSPLCPKLEDVPLLEPLVCKRIASERLNDLVFHEDCLLISTQEGVIMTWSRPGRVPANTSSRQNSCSN